MNLNDIILPLHLLVLLYAVWNIFHADHLGLKWITGKINVLHKEDIRKYHVRVWIGLIGMIITGFIMFWPMHEYLLTRWQFLLKISFVIALVANGFAIGSIQDVATKKRFKELTLREKIPLFISGAVSSIGWIGAAIMAFFIIPD